jgi:hypothetical protein
MKRSDLEHVIRAAGSIADVTKLVIIGSQSILGKYPRPPASLTVSNEADLYPPTHPERSDLIDAVIGRDSAFHATFGYYADGVDEKTATLPEGWEARLVEINNDNTQGVSGFCLDPHDLAASKLAAGRDKDLAFVEVMISAGYIDLPTLRERAVTMPVEVQVAQLIFARISNFEEKQSAKVSPSPGPKLGM